jgi:hypothetical protein
VTDVSIGAGRLTCRVEQAPAAQFGIFVLISEDADQWQSAIFTKYWV